MVLKILFEAWDIFTDSWMLFRHILNAPPGVVTAWCCVELDSLGVCGPRQLLSAFSGTLGIVEDMDAWVPQMSSR